MFGQYLPLDPNHWVKYGGILGLIILFLLVGGFLLIKWLVSHLDTNEARHREERREWQVFSENLSRQHREERKEWREAASAEHAALRKSLEQQQQEMHNSLERGLDRISTAIDHVKDSDK